MQLHILTPRCDWHFINAWLVLSLSRRNTFFSRTSILDLFTICLDFPVDKPELTSRLVSWSASSNIDCDSRMSLYMAGIISVTLELGLGCCLEHLWIQAGQKFGFKKENISRRFSGQQYRLTEELGGIVAGLQQISQGLRGLRYIAPGLTFIQSSKSEAEPRIQHSLKSSNAPNQELTMLTVRLPHLAAR